MGNSIKLTAIFACFAAHGLLVSGQDTRTENKIRTCQELVNAAVPFFEKSSIDEACAAFIRKPEWRRGSIGVFVFDESGTCYAFGRDRRPIWKDFQTEKTVLQEDFITKMVEEGHEGGAVSFRWDNGYMRSHVRSVMKQGRMYIIGAGFYPDSGKYLVESMVMSAIGFAANNDVSILFERINNPSGIFVQGDSYLSVFDMKGVCVAHGSSIELIGQNLINEVTQDGKYRTRDLLAIAKSKKGSGWYEYTTKQGSVRRLLYVSRLTAQNGTEYAVVGGYYPDITEGDTRAMVKRAVSYLRTHGSKQAFAKFSQPRGEFAYGGIQLFVYNKDGIIVADMANPAFVGQDLSNTVDADGQFVTKTILQQAEKFNSGWVSFHLKNAYVMMYIEKVKLPDGDFIVGASYFPIGNQVSVRFMVEKAARYLEQTVPEEALYNFATGSSEFMRGNTYITVYTEDGVTLVDGPFRQAIWSKDTALVDEKGLSSIKKVVAIAKSGGGWMEYDANNAKRRVYAKLVTKPRRGTNHKEQLSAKSATDLEVENFIVTAGYYV